MPLNYDESLQDTAEIHTLFLKRCELEVENGEGRSFPGRHDDLLFISKNNIIHILFKISLQFINHGFIVRTSKQGVKFKYLLSVLLLMVVCSVGLTIHGLHYS